MANADILAGLDPVFRDKVIEWLALLEQRGWKVLLTSGFRTASQQDALYAIGRSKPGRKVTHARGTPVMQSLHCFGCAVDFAPLVMGIATYDKQLLTQYAELAKSIGLESGADWVFFPDYPHLEYTQGQPLSYFQKGGKLVKDPNSVELPPLTKLANLSKRLARTTNAEARRIIGNVIERFKKRL